MPTSFMDADLARSGLVASDLHSTASPNPFAPPGTTSSKYRIPYWLADATPHPFMYRERLEHPAPGKGKYMQPSSDMAVAAGRPESDVLYPYFNPVILQRVWGSGMTWSQVAALTPPKGDGKLFCLVEGEKKAVAVGLFCGRLAIGIGGCDNGAVQQKDGSYEPHPALLEIVQPGDRVEVVFDADMRVNPNVARAAGTLQRALRRFGIRVSFIVLPPTTKGIDDWLMLHPAAERVVAFESLPRVRYDRGELPENRDALVCFLDLPRNGDTGAVICNESAAGKVFDRHERYLDRIWVEDSLNAMFETVSGDKPLPVTDAFVQQQGAWFQTHVNHSFTPQRVKNAFSALPADPSRHRNRVHDYLRSLKWDGNPRLEEMFIVGWGAADDTYTRAIGNAWMVGVVARAMRPGCTMQHMLVLEGPQGIGKSRSLAAIGGEWYVESLTPMEDKDFLLSAHRSLLFDLAELGAYKFADFAFVKGLLSTAIDHIRAPYGTHVETRPRRFVCVATTNETTYLRDLTGNRRFWPMACGKIDMKWIEANRDQLFAEAKVRLDAGAEWWVDDQLTLAVQDARVTRDPWEDLIENVLITVQQAPVLVIDAVPYHFVASETLTTAIAGTSANGGHGQRLHGLMRKHFSDWEIYEYSNPNKPMNINGVLKAKVRGFRKMVGLARTGATPLPDPTPIKPPSRPGTEDDSTTPGNPFITK